MMMELTEKDLARFASLLPPVAIELIQLVGMSNTYELIRVFGGTTFPVSHNRRKLGKIRWESLAEVVGVDAANFITKRYGGADLYVPKCEQAMREARNTTIKRQFDEMTKGVLSPYEVVSDLARTHRISDRHVWRILKEAIHEENGTVFIQDDLF